MPKDLREEKAATSTGSAASPATTRAPLTSVRSRSQLTRRQSYTSRKNTAGSSPFGSTATEKPILGGLTGLDIFFIAISYGLNLLKTLGIAELLDVALKGLYYCSEFIFELTKSLLKELTKCHLSYESFFASL